MLFVFLIVSFLIRTCLIICLICSSSHPTWVENQNLVFFKPVLSINLLYLKANFFFLISWVARHFFLKIVFRYQRDTEVEYVFGPGTLLCFYSWYSVLWVPHLNSVHQRLKIF